MRAFVLAGLFAVAATVAFHAKAGEPPAAIPLWLAAKDGKVAVRGGSTGSYTEAQVTIQNSSDGEISVDVNGSYLMPSGDYQRLGLGLLKKGSSVTEVRIAKGATAKVNVLSVCMDASKHAPGMSTPFVFVAAAPPPAIERALQRWKKEPGLEQGAVQCNVWNVDAPVRKAKKEKGPIPCDLPVATRRVAACDGTVFVLVGPGELLAARPGQEFKSVAQDVEDVVACEGALHALFRAAPAAVTSGTRERRFCVARLERGQWTEELTVAKLGHLEWATSGVAILADGPELAVLAGKPGGRAAARRAIGKATDQVLATAGGALVFAPSSDGARLTRVTVQGERVDLSTQEVGVALKSIAIWDGVLLGATSRGELLRVNDDSSVKNVQFLLDGRGGQITRKAKSLGTLPTGVLVGLDDGLYVLGTDKSLTSFSEPPSGSTLTVDPVSHELFAHSGEELRSFDSAWKQVKFVMPPSPDGADAEDVDAACVTSGTVAATSSR